MGTKARSTQTARKLRRELTEAEKRFWEIVRNRRFFGKKFLRQHPLRFPYMGDIRYFVADFYCNEASLVVEIDGRIHDNQKEQDAYRTELINNVGIAVVRLKNDDAGCIEKITEKLKPYFPHLPLFSEVTEVRQEGKF